MYSRQEGTSCKALAQSSLEQARALFLFSDFASSIGP